MRVQCPHCGTSGNLPDHKVPSTGMKITCPKCKSSFFVQKDKTMPDKGQNAATYCKKGMKLLRGKRVDAAIEKFNRAIQINPQYAEAYRYLGLAYGQKNLWAEASEVFQKARQLNPNDIQSLKNLGVTYLQQKRFVEAEQVLRKVLQTHPADEKAKSYLGMAIKRQKQQQTLSTAPKPASSVKGGENAISEDNPTPPRSIKSAPKDPLRELLDQGTECLDNAQYSKAIEAFTEVVRLAPHSSDGYVGLGMVYEKRGEWKNAISAYQNALKIDPNDPVAKENLRFVEKQGKKFRWQFWKKG